MVDDENPSRGKGHWSITLNFGPPSSIVRLLSHTHTDPTQTHTTLHTLRPPLRSRIATATDIKCRSNNVPNLLPSFPPPSPSKTQARTRPCTRSDSPLSTARSSHSRPRGHEANRSLCLDSSRHVCHWLKGEEDDDAESAHTTSEEDPIVVPPTPVEYGESENLDRAIQRGDKLRIYASVSTGHSFPSAIAGSLENSVTEYRDLSSSFLGGTTESTTVQVVVRSR